jgi:hypothetical protein
MCIFDRIAAWAGGEALMYNGSTLAPRRILGRNVFAGDPTFAV